VTEIATVLAGAARIVTPGREEERKVGKVAEKVLARVNSESKGHPEVRGVITGGSYAKGTWLPDDVDIDIFVKISPDVGDERFEEVGLKVGTEAVRGYKHGKMYAQHPYTEATVDGIKVNIVPCYDVRPGEWKSAADRSQFHVTFVQENLSPEAKTEVRLLKKFMRVIGVYGAEIEKEGFSGYAAEVLVHREGGFEKVLGYFAGLKPEAGGLSLLDPIDSQRELAKAISAESAARLALASRAFLRDPGLTYFKEVRGKTHPKLQGSLYAIVFKHKELSEDTLWGELKRSTKQITKHVEGEGFKVARSIAASDNSSSSAIIILPEVVNLPSLERRVGPEVGRAKEATAFIAKNRAKADLTWVGQDGRLHVLMRRRDVSLSGLLASIVGGGGKGLGVSREVASAMAKTGRVLTGERLSRECKKAAWLRRAVLIVTSDSIGVD
jgi:tRNA nucleotidyltransferase (CCA-adding enzyme)